MWKRIPLILWTNKLQNVRTYVPKAGNMKVAKAVKTLKGKATAPPPKEDKITRSKQREVIFHTPEFEDDPEGFGDFESDFMQVHKSHKEYEIEAAQYQERVRHWIVKNKYFKEKLPNFLTYAEKEQIKSLNSQDPEEWTPEKLSESFPADPMVIAKIIKAKWSVRSEERIKQHDEGVMRNWSLFRAGKMSHLNKELVEHLQRFANRSIEDLKGTETGTRTFPQLPTPKSSEFASIITSCKKYKENTKLPEPTESPAKEVHRSALGSPNKDQEDSFVMGEILDRRRMRLQDLKDRQIIPSEPESDTRLPVIENPGGTGILQPLNKPETTEIVVSKDDMKTYEMNAIKEKIHIPRKLWRRGATYKVEDCYYDDDGEFLYRVPGMTGRKMQN